MTRCALALPTKLKFTPIHMGTSACPKTSSPLSPALKQAPPLSPKSNFQRQQSERNDHKPQNFGINGKDRVSRSSPSLLFTITNLTDESVCLHCSHHNLNVSIHDWICSRVSMSVATNYSCFVSTIMCFYQHFFNVSINNSVVANVAPEG